MTLYLKYRPKNLDELDLSGVRDTLKNILKSENIPHAFLFAGPKGTGKTSAARILAKIINCESVSEKERGSDLLMPCNECEQCTSITKGVNLDVIEMDAASHRGIDDVRILRDAVKLAPVKSKKKIYIIDEAHMLTTEASNALLKTIEEPPEHVIFILATTNPEKLIDTVRSRVTSIPFKKASIAELVLSLKRVAAGEKVKISDESLKLIAGVSDGAFRDAIKIFDQLIGEGSDLTKESLEEYFQNKKAYDLDKFIRLLADKNTSELIREVSGLEKNNVSIEVFMTNLIRILRASLLAKVGIGEGDIALIDKKDTVLLIEYFSEAIKNIGMYPIDELPLELAIIKWCEFDKKENRNRNNTEKNEEIENLPVRDAKDDKTENSQDEASRIDSLNQSEPVTDEIQNVNDDVWKNILSQIKPINASIEALLRAARPINFDGRTLTLGVYYKFHKERLEDAHHRKILEEVIENVLKMKTRVVCTLVDPPARKIVSEVKTETVLTEGKDRDIIKVAEEIFGS